MLSTQDGPGPGQWRWVGSGPWLFVTSLASQQNEFIRRGCLHHELGEQIVFNIWADIVYPPEYYSMVSLSWEMVQGGGPLPQALPARVLPLNEEPNLTSCFSHDPSFWALASLSFQASWSFE